MKRILTYIALMMCCLPCSADPEITFRDTDGSLGTFRLDLIQEHDYVYLNTGDEPLEIYSVHPGCPCVTVEYDTGPLAPGDSAVIHVRYNARRQPEGRFTKPIRVRSNASNPQVRLTLRGKAIKG